MSVVVEKNRSVLDYATDAAVLQALIEVRLSGPSSEDGLCRPQISDWLLPTLDSKTTVHQSVALEAQRLRSLKSFKILDSEREEAFDEITEQARRTFDARWALVSLVDLGRQWFKSCAPNDLAASETPRSVAICAHTIQAKSAVLVVADTHADNRFKENPLVVSAPHLRFYAGAPITDPQGFRLGTLCVVDQKPRPQGLSDEEEAQLISLAASVAQRMVERVGKMAEQTRKRRASLARADSSPSIIPASRGPNAKEESAPKRSRSNPRCGREREDVAPAKAVAPVCHKVARQNIIKKVVGGAVPPFDPRNIGNPDEYLLRLVKSTWGVSLKVKPAFELQEFFPVTTEAQMAAYTVEIVTATRNNDIPRLRQILESKGRASLDCFNRFGEGLLNMACRRGFTEMVEFLLSDEVGLSVRVRDDWGRTPLHDACWNPAPQLDVCTWIMEKDPFLYLVTDKRGYTPFQYARKSDWPVWCKFLHDNVNLLEPLTRPDTASKFMKG